MKVIVNTLMGKCINFDLNENAKIGDLRAKLETVLNMSADKFHVSSIVGHDNQKLCVIYSNASKEEKLLDFIRLQVNKPQLHLDELKIHIVRNLTPQSIFQASAKTTETIAASVTTPTSESKSYCSIQ